MFCILNLKLYLQETDSRKLMHTNIKKKDGFNGQRAIVLPQQVIRFCTDTTLLKNLFITDIGFYPKAEHHFREREAGSSQHILIYCTDGCGWAIINKERFEIKENSFLIIPKNTKHQYGADQLNPWSIFWVHFSGENASDFNELLIKTSGSFLGSISYSEKRTRIFDEIYGVLESGYSNPHLYYINLLFSSYLGTFCFQEFVNPPKKEEQNKIDQVIEYMQEHLLSTVSLKELAATIHMSASHFSAVFKKKTGYAPLEYFNHLKLQRACQYLEFTDMTVKELSYKLGLSDPFYFSRLFSRNMGESPLAYRKRKQFK